MKIHNRLLVTPGKKTKLSDIDPDDTLGLKNDERSHKMLQFVDCALLQASALEKGRAVVNAADVDRVLHLMNWVNFNENPISPNRCKS